MTVAELIAQLQTMPADLEVRVTLASLNPERYALQAERYAGQSTHDRWATGFIEPGRNLGATKP
jgi:hypothetical protein